MSEAQVRDPQRSALLGRRVLVTRPQAQADEFVRSLQDLGAEVTSFPVIEIRPVEDPAVLDRALKALSGYHWLVLTSVNGVEAVWTRLEALAIADLPAGLRVAAIGPKTAAALESRGVKPDFVPPEYVAEAILPGLGDLRGQRVLLARADLARKALAEGIRAAGGTADEIPAYRTLPAAPNQEGIDALREGVDFITFTSSSTVRNFAVLAAAAGLDPHCLVGHPRFVCIGPITARTAEDEGFLVAAVADEYTAEGLIKALIKLAK